MTTYEIIRLGQHGDGIADGPVFAPLTLPGELVTGDLVGDRLQNVRVVTPSDQRVSPPCRHFKSCGGCQLQHANDALVAEWKQNVVREALRGRGLEAPLRDIVTSPSASRRRATFSARRTKKGAMAGFHGRASDVIIEIPDCKLLVPELLAAKTTVEALALIGASRKGEINVAVTQSSAGLDVAVSNGRPLDGAFEMQLAQEAERLKLARLSWNGETIATRHMPVQDIGGYAVVPPPNAFLQATADGEAKLRAAILEIAQGQKSAVDLFAGCGTFSLPLAESAEVLAVEGDGAMMDALDQAWRKTSGLKRVTCETRDLYRRPLLPDELNKFAMAVIDPPRAGAEAQIAEIAHSEIAKIAYASCNPITFSRDAAVLIGAGFALDWVQVVDQFRWSSHIELVGSFTRS